MDHQKNRGGRPRGSRSKARAPAHIEGRSLTRVVGYVRVSTERQAEEGVSLEAQRARLHAHCVAHDLELVEIAADEGVSAKTLERAGLKRALAMLRDGHADALLVPKLDRLTRRVVDLGCLIETYFASDNWALMSVADRIDTRTAAGRMTLFILMSVAQWEREAIGERTADALAHLRAEGVKLGRAGFGWCHASRPNPTTGRRDLLPVFEETATVTRILALRAEGASYASISGHLTSEGCQPKRGGQWFPNTVRRICLREGRSPKDLAKP